jgi:hypothetical protein
MKGFGFIITFLLVAGIAFGATVDGRWDGTANGQSGPETISYKFTSDGNILTGVVLGGGTESPIRDGKIEGNKISFIVDVEYGGQKMSFPYTGIVSQDQITFNAEIMGQSMEIVVKRAVELPAGKGKQQ